MKKRDVIAGLREELSRCRSELEAKRLQLRGLEAGIEPPTGPSGFTGLAPETVREIFQPDPIGFLLGDAEGRVFDVNDALVSILGSPSREQTKRINLLTFPPL
ncbi:MAG TPA: hypothetical protein VIV61_18675, partial [Candidatus Ozemobacteraceae bacterium]